MPNFPKNTSSFMKYSEKGSTFPFKTDEAKNLLKAVPNKEAYNKLSNQDKKGFDKAAKEAGLPTKAGPLKGTTPGHFTMPETIQMKKPGLPSPATKKIEKIPTLPSKKLPTNTKMGHGNKPIDFERGGYGQKLDPKKAGFPGDYTPKKEAAPLRKKTGKRKLKKLDKKVEKRNLKESKERLSKLSTEELMSMRATNRYLKN